jgi:ComF family protein
MLSDFFALIYPRLCLACCGNLTSGEEYLCISCQYNLPQTRFSSYKENELSKLFWGRTSIETAASYFYFNRGSKVQQLIYQLKYNGKKELGIYLGQQYAMELKNSTLFNSIDTIVAVPLHPKKIKSRGYNQSEYFALGISNTINKEVNFKALYRIQASSTQTKKSRYERWENVEHIFVVKNPETIKGKHILLVDDVITTGSTIEACANTLLKI